MQAPGTVFVAVAAGLLAAPDSLLVQLASAETRHSASTDEANSSSHRIRSERQRRPKADIRFAPR